MHTGLKARTDKVGEYFEIQKGIKQGDSLSSILFLAALEESFEKLNWERNGININGVYLNHLRFADDIVLMTESHNELKK